MIKSFIKENKCFSEIKEIFVNSEKKKFKDLGKQQHKEITRTFVNNKSITETTRTWENNNL